MEANKNIFKVGDKVYLYPLGWGDIQYKSDYDYSIYFESIQDKRYIGGDVRSLLSFTEYTLKGLSQERPKELPKPGDIVWVRDSEYDNWMITYFRKYAIDRELKYGTNPRNSGSSQDCYFYRYLTTENPYK